MGLLKIAKQNFQTFAIVKKLAPQKHFGSDIF
jgi:hypothetical protein